MKLKKYAIAIIIVVAAIVDGNLLFLQNANSQTLPILITEVQIGWDGSRNADFIELYNQNDTAVDLKDYKLRKKTSTGNESSIISIGATAANSPTTIIPAKGYFLWASSETDFHIQVGAQAFTGVTLAANNSIALKNPDGIIVDAVAWGEGLTNPFVMGAVFPKSPEESNTSLSRIREGNGYRNTGNNSVDFAISNTPTPDRENSATQVSQTQSSSLNQAQNQKQAPSQLQEQIIEPPPTAPIKPPEEQIVQAQPQAPTAQQAATQEPTTQQSVTQQSANRTGQPDQIVQSDKSDKSGGIEQNVFINEFLPYPEGSDAQEEWIELFNAGSVPADISGFKLSDGIGAATVYTVASGTLVNAQGFLVFDRPKTGIILNNDGEKIILRNPMGEAVSVAEYSGKAQKGNSFARREDGSWVWTSAVTPGMKNVFRTLASQTPLTKEKSVVVTPSASNSKKDEALNLKDASKTVEASVLGASKGARKDFGLFSSTAAIAVVLALLSSLAIVILKMLISKTGHI